MADRCLLYYITDRSQFRGDECARRRVLLAKVAEAARAGIDYIQLREKDLSTRELECLAQEVVGLVRENSSSMRLFINSRADVALAAGADGVHLRADDISPAEVGAVVQLSAHQPPTTDHFLVAASCHTAADVFRAESEADEFAVFAPVFEKNDTQMTGLA